jgi:enoyl-CoA hydratase/carnithine racemase
MSSEADSTEAPVLSEIEDRVGWITLNRPQALNAITVELATQLHAALLDLGTRTSVIVIRGAGGNFCVGGDFTALQELQARGTDAMRELFVSFHRACAAIAGLAVPVIAAVEGYAMAGGFELMQAADIALVREDAKLADNHSNFGQVPGGGSSQRLPRLVGRQRALALILTGERLTGGDAVDWGLAYRAYPADTFTESVHAFAAKLADKSSDALARSKRLVYDGLALPLSEGIELETEVVLEHLSGAAASEGMTQFNSGRTPR